LDKIAGILLIAILSLVSVAGLSSYVLSQPNQTQINPSSTSIPTSTPVPSPIEKQTEQASAIKPSVPEFTMKIVDNSYEVPVTYTSEIDRFTGEERRISHGGYHVENKSVVFTIKNQPFTPYTAKGGNITVLAYSVRVKGHFEEDWTKVGYIDSSDGEYTIKSYGLGESSDIYMLRGVPSGGQVDFQVQALIGYFYEEFDYDTHSALFYLYFPGITRFVGEESGWSRTQTLTIP
jgi:hypothetical protein